ncbi:peptidase M4, partial [Streptomyces sp. SID337]|nr:peptidase M4 [Streptomyces sp. SID337]
MRNTSHRHAPRTRSVRTRATAAGALSAVAALLAVAVQAGPASADDPAAKATPAAAQKLGKVDPGALAAKLSPAQRAELIRDANATKAETAEDLGLGAKEKLVVRDV